MKVLVTTLFLTISSGVFAQTTYSDFVNCVQSSTNGTWGSTCTLPGNTSHSVTSTITVGRAPLTIQGSGVTSALQRANYTSTAGPSMVLLSVPATVTLIGGGPYSLTIKDLIIDGNRNNQCKSVGNCLTVANADPANYWDSWSAFAVEIQIQRSSQSVNVKIDNLTLYDAPGYGVHIRRGAYGVNNVDIRNCHFGISSPDKGGAYLSPILIQVDSLSSAGDLPYNPVILWNEFRHSGGGAIAGNNVLYPQMFYNQFFGNHREFPHRSPGGQGIYVAYNSTADSSYAQLYDNYLDGENVQSSTYSGTAGLEIEGSFHTIELNQMTNHRRQGISINGVHCAKLVTNSVTNSGGDTVSAPPSAVEIKADTLPQAADIWLSQNSVYNNVVPGFRAWTGGNNVTRIDYSTNTGNGAYFYSNTGGSVAAGSASSASWNSSCGTLP